MLTYSELTQEQRDKISNGCGGKGSWIPVPNFIFKASCNQHDFYYWRGCSEEDKVKADKAFYRFMRMDIADLPVSKFWLKLCYHGWALTYYLSVRQFGKSYFHYADEMKTLEDTQQQELI